MIRYALTCDQNHGFESWFQSSAAFDRLQAGGHVACTVCGSTEVAKDLMAPAVATPPAPLAATKTPVEEALAAMRRQVEEQSEYVGLNFAAEARAIHEGDRPQRAIYGEAKVDEAKRLIEDGIPVAPLPFLPKVRTN